MRSPREVASRVRAVMGVHRVGELEERVAELGSAVSENTRLDAALEGRVAELEAAVTQVASRRRPGV